MPKNVVDDAVDGTLRPTSTSGPWPRCTFPVNPLRSPRRQSLRPATTGPPFPCPLPESAPDSRWMASVAGRAPRPFSRVSGSTPSTSFLPALGSAWGTEPPVLTARRRSATAPSSSFTCVVTELEAPPAERLADTRDAGSPDDRRWSRALLGIGVAGLLLAALLSPLEPLPLPLALRWLAAYVLFVLLPGCLLVSLLLPRWTARSGAWLECAVLAVAAGSSLAVLLGLILHTLFRPIAPWQIATGGGLLVAALAVGAARRYPPSRGATPSGAMQRAPTADDVAGARCIAPTTPATPTLGTVSARHLLARCWPVLLLLAVAAPLRLSRPRLERVSGRRSQGRPPRDGRAPGSRRCARGPP